MDALVNFAILMAALRSLPLFCQLAVAMTVCGLALAKGAIVAAAEVQSYNTFAWSLLFLLGTLLVFPIVCPSQLVCLARFLRT
jgi:hypothetical protein